jgi:hypothetical protein
VDEPNSSTAGPSSGRKAKERKQTPTTLSPTGSSKHHASVSRTSYYSVSGPPKMRLNSKQAHVARKESAEMKLNYSQHIKKATQLCAKEAKKPKKQRKSAEKIVREINEKENVKICPKTVRNYVNNG